MGYQSKNKLYGTWRSNFICVRNLCVLPRNTKCYGQTSSDRNSTKICSFIKFYQIHPVGHQLNNINNISYVKYWVQPYFLFEWDFSCLSLFVWFIMVFSCHKVASSMFTIILYVCTVCVCHLSQNASIFKYLYQFILNLY